MQARNQDQPGRQESSWGRSIGMFLFACTGIGALYMLACTRWIEPGKVGVVSNYLTGEREILEPGIHCILSPFRRFEMELPFKDRDVLEEYNGMRVHTADNIETSVQIELTYHISDPKKAVTNIEGDYREGVKKNVKRALANVIREDSFSFASLAAPVLPQIPLPPSDENSSQERKQEITSTAQPADLRKGRFGMLSERLVAVVSSICEKFGVTITGFQITDMKAVDQEVERRIEAQSYTQFNSAGLLTAATNDQRAKLIYAQTEAKQVQIAAEAEAARIKMIMKAQTDAQKERLQTMAQCISDSKVAQVMALDTQIKISENLSQIKGTLAGTPFNMFTPQPQLLAGTQALEAKAPTPAS